MALFKKIIKILLLAMIVFCLCISLLIGYIQTHNDEGIPILGYHGVVSEQIKQKKYPLDQYTLGAREFEEQLKYLKQHHYQTLSMDQLLAYYEHRLILDKNQKYVALTFDDGLKNYKTMVEPLLKKYHFQATCFVIGKKLKQDNPKYLNTHDIKNNAYSHYYSHSYDLHHHGKGLKKRVQCLSKKQLAKDFYLNQQVLNCRYVAYPYGRSDEDYVAVLKANHVKLAFSYNQFHHFTFKDDRYEVPRYLMFSKMGLSYLKVILG